MNLFQEHLPGCTPLNPCANCATANFLRSKLSKEDFATLSEMMEEVKVAKVYKDVIWNKPVSDLTLTSATTKLLEKLAINSIGDLVTKTEEWLIQCKSLDRKRLNEIKRFLTPCGLTLGMKPEFA